MLGRSGLDGPRRSGAACSRAARCAPDLASRHARRQRTRSVADFSEWPAGLPALEFRPRSSRRRQGEREVVGGPGSPQLRRLQRTQVDGLSTTSSASAAPARSALEGRRRARPADPRSKCAPIDSSAMTRWTSPGAAGRLDVGRGERRPGSGLTRFTRPSRRRRWDRRGWRQEHRARRRRGLRSGPGRLRRVHRRGGAAEVGSGRRDPGASRQRPHRRRALQRRAVGAGSGALGGRAGEPGGPVKVERVIEGGTIGRSRGAKSEASRSRTSRGKRHARPKTRSAGLSHRIREPK